MNDAAPQQRLLTLLQPVLDKVAELAPAKRDQPDSARALVSALDEAFPYDGEVAQSIGEEIRRGIDEGWLCNKGDDNAKFSRLAKPSPQTHNLSIDIVSLQGPALEHTHPAGEVTLGFPSKGHTAEARFDGHPPGWVFKEPGSRHVPTVEGGRMDLIYFLPGGAVEWHK
jgi:hypothetical protein